MLATSLRGSDHTSGGQRNVARCTRGGRNPVPRRFGARGRHAAPATERRHVNLWVAPACLDETLLAQSAILDDTDRAAAGVIRHAAQRRRALASKVLLRLALSSHVNGAVAPEQWHFSAEDSGKPTVGGAPYPVHFSLSHNEAGTVVAVCRSPVGVDLEALDQPAGGDMLAFFLSPRERAALQVSENGESRREAFLKLWTLKEAYTKLLGTGLAAEFSDLEFSLDPVQLLDTAAPPTQFGTWSVMLNHRPCHISLAHAPNRPTPLASNLRVMIVSDVSGMHLEARRHRTDSNFPEYCVGKDNGVCDRGERTEAK